MEGRRAGFSMMQERGERRRGRGRTEMTSSMGLYSSPASFGRSNKILGRTR